MSLYRDSVSDAKAFVNEYLIAGSIAALDKALQNQIWLLDAEHTRTTEALVAAGIDASRIRIIECNSRTESKIRARLSDSAALQAVQPSYGNLFDVCSTAAQDSSRPKVDVIYADLMQTTISDDNLKSLLRACRACQVKLLFITLSARGTAVGDSLQARFEKICKKAKTFGFRGCRFAWGYQRSAGSQPMLVFGLQSQACGTFRRIRERRKLSGGKFKVNYYGFPRVEQVVDSATASADQETAVCKWLNIAPPSAVRLASAAADVASSPLQVQSRLSNRQPGVNAKRKKRSRADALEVDKPTTGRKKRRFAVLGAVQHSRFKQSIVADRQRRHRSLAALKAERSTLRRGAAVEALLTGPLPNLNWPSVSSVWQRYKTNEWWRIQPALVGLVLRQASLCVPDLLRQRVYANALAQQSHGQRESVSLLHASALAAGLVDGVHSSPNQASEAMALCMLDTMAADPTHYLACWGVFKMTEVIGRIVENGSTAEPPSSDKVKCVEHLLQLICDATQRPIEVEVQQTLSASVARTGDLCVFTPKNAVKRHGARYIRLSQRPAEYGRWDLVHDTASASVTFDIDQPKSKQATKDILPYRELLCFAARQDSVRQQQQQDDGKQSNNPFAFSEQAVTGEGQDLLLAKQVGQFFAWRR